MLKEKFISPAVGKKLRDIRKQKGVKSADLLSKLMGARYSPSGILRREEGKLKIDFSYLEDFCNVLKLTQPDRKKLLTTARLNVWNSQRSMLDLSKELFGLWSSAKDIQCYEYSGIPTELQTYNYVYSVVANYLAYGDIKDRAKLRYKNAQDFLNSKTRNTSIVFHENTFYAPIGSPQIMIEQLNHLKGVSSKPGFVWRIIPNSLFLKKSLSFSFLILDKFFVICESRNGMISTENQATANELLSDLEVIRGNSVSGEEANKLIDKAIAHYQAML